MMTNTPNTSPYDPASGWYIKIHYGSIILGGFDSTEYTCDIGGGM
jgi:hypothetical protein